MITCIHAAILHACALLIACNYHPSNSSIFVKSSLLTYQSAIEKYFYDNEENLPESLSDISAYLQPPFDTFYDPFSPDGKQSFHFARTTKHFIVWSVGKDKVTDASSVLRLQLHFCDDPTLIATSDAGEITFVYHNVSVKSNPNRYSGGTE